jgi:hypothetical protein
MTPHSNGETDRMTTARVFIGFAVAVCIVGAVAPAWSETRAVIELFTSEGCSSCPPADKLLGELRNDSSLITLSLHIDYWDYLGWKDSLALPGHSARQRAYSHIRGDREIYTPQVVVNGAVQALGSDRGEIEKAMTQTSRATADLKVPIRVAIAEQRITIALPNGIGDGASGEVWLCPVSRSVAVGIGRGENRGHTITYTNVVRGWVKLGTWSGKSETFSVPIESIKAAGADEIAILLQSGSADQPGAMLGAALAALR